MQAPLIYNLFPRLAGDMTRWRDHAARARAMGFDWLYVNPFHYPGFSGSIYAVKDHDRVDPAILPPGHPDAHYEDDVRGDGGIELLRMTITAIRELGLRPIMDLVINHTSRDSLLAARHPGWFVRDAHGKVQSPHAIDPADARRVTVWGDLAEVDNANSPERDALWEHWTALVTRHAKLGFEGFRCDAAYKVPAELWSALIAAARAVRPEAAFFAETLGARLEEIEELRSAGFHFLMNSSKWWDFEAPWCLEQQRRHASIAPSVSFPESHDTPRLWAESGGAIDAQRQRYAFAAAFSTGVMMPVGYEFGFSRRLDVVHTRAADWEEPACDLTGFVRLVNETKRSHPALAGEEVEAQSAPREPVLLLEKRAGESQAWIAINKDRTRSHEIALDALPRARVHRLTGGGADDEAAGTLLSLAPAEVAYVIPD